MTRLINHKSTSHITDLFPNDVIKLNECVGQISVLDFKKENVEEYEEITVVESYSPSNFWIRPWKNADPFHDMMEKLDVFYEAHKSKYVIPKNAFQFGLHIACKYFNKWHRGMIKNTNDYPEVEVFFFDYGTVESYHAKELYFLHYSFGKLPGQAVLCGLFNIRPLDNFNWPLTTRQNFFNKSSNKILIAFVGKIDEDNNSLLIDLVDTSKDEDCHLGDWLVENKLAQYGVNRIKSRNYFHEFDVQCGGNRPMIKYPSSFPNSQVVSSSKKSSLSTNEKNNNDEIKSLVIKTKNREEDSSRCCHVCAKCGQEFGDHDVKKIQKKNLPNDGRQLKTQDDVYNPENGFIPEIELHEVNHSDTIDWSQFKVPADDKKNEKKSEKSSGKELTSTDNLKNIEKSKKNIVKVDHWYSIFVNQKADINYFVDVVSGEITPSVRNEMRSTFKDPPEYKKIIIPGDVNSMVNNGDRVSVSATSPENSLSFDVAILDSGVEKQVVIVDDDKHDRASTSVEGSLSLDVDVINSEKKTQIVDSGGKKEQDSTSTTSQKDLSLDIFDSEKEKQIFVANEKNDQALNSPEDSSSLDVDMVNFEKKKRNIDERNQASSSKTSSKDSKLDTFDSEKKKQTFVGNEKNDRALTLPENSSSLDVETLNFEKKKQTVVADDKKENSLMRFLNGKKEKMKFTDIIKSLNEKTKYSSNSSELDSDDLSSISMIEGEDYCEEVEGWTFD